MRLILQNDLENLNLRFRVPCMRYFDEEARTLISESRVSSLLTHDQESTLLRGMNVSNLELVVRIADAAVIFDEIWRVTICAYSLRQCISSMAMLINAMTEDMNLAISVAVIEVEGNKDLSLPDTLRRSDRREVNDGLIWVGTSVVASGILGLVVGYLLAGGIGY